MKLRAYKLLFQIFSFLADKTNGAYLVVKYKLLLGTLIIGIVGTACSQKKTSSQAECYVMVMPPEIEDTTINSQPKEGSTTSDVKYTSPSIGQAPEIPEGLIMCYDPIVVDTVSEIEPEFYVLTEKEPIPPQGSNEELLNWIKENLRYPQSMLDNKVEGRVIAHIMIDTLGNVTNVDILKGLTPEADEEAIRVLSMLAPWTPGEHLGKKVKVQRTVAVTFRLPKN